MIFDVLRCPQCGSQSMHGGPKPERGYMWTCDACSHQWKQEYTTIYDQHDVDALVCPHCGKPMKGATTDALRD